MGTAVKPITPKWPVVEIFGPTIQGEGVDQGVTAHFVRFGGCDFRCDWCDTPHAVIPEEVRKNATKMSVDGIIEELEALGDQVPWVILTGGNPALHDLSSLVDELHNYGILVAVETQGSKWREWFSKVDRLCISPKPPSAGQEYDWTQVQRFFEEGLKVRLDEERGYEWLFVKIPVFDVRDLDWAETVRSQLSNALLYLSAGNDAGRTVGNPHRQDHRSYQQVVMDLLMQSKWLVDQVFDRPRLCRQDVIVQTQYHVLLWGNEKGR